MIERLALMDPSMGDGGTTWSGIELKPYEAVSEAFDLKDWR